MSTWRLRTEFQSTVLGTLSVPKQRAVVKRITQLLQIRIHTPDPIKICLRLASPEFTMTQPTRVSYNIAVTFFVFFCRRRSTTVCAVCVVSGLPLAVKFLQEYATTVDGGELGSCSARRAFSRVHESSRKIQNFLYWIPHRTCGKVAGVRVPYSTPVYRSAVRV